METPSEDRERGNISQLIIRASLTPILKPDKGIRNNILIIITKTQFLNKILASRTQQYIKKIRYIPERRS